MGKKRLIGLFVSLLCTLSVLIGATVAYLVTTAGPLTNTFTTGDISITLEETASEAYQLIPGKQFTKDPRVTVEGGSEDCWLFIKVDKTDKFDEYITYAMAEGWHSLLGSEGVYYRSVPKSESNTVFSVLSGDQVTVRDDLTKVKMEAIAVKPKITFSAYAVQSLTVDDAFTAWSMITSEVQR